jgi:hypothetical protein
MNKRVIATPAHWPEAKSDFDARKSRQPAIILLTGFIACAAASCAKTSESTNTMARIV